jgi:hypothetical protein
MINANNSSVIERRKLGRRAAPAPGGLFSGIALICTTLSSQNQQRQMTPLVISNFV